ncbi:MAG TPA: hypothetical protein PLS69_04075 [Terricaulis sp.]|nr:hypothetical protein [Terricaulis sp.]
MTETERALRQSVTPHAAAIAAIDRTRLLIGAAPLASDADTHLLVSIEDLQTLVRLGDEAISYRADTAPPAIGADHCRRRSQPLRRAGRVRGRRRSLAHRRADRR